VRGDIGYGDLVATLVDEYGIDACIHFAGKIAVGESVDNPAPPVTSTLMCTGLRDPRGSREPG
jgi:UDP-glucose 4-epimerase